MPDHRDSMPERPETAAAPVTWPETAPLADALRLLRTSQAVFCECELAAPWGLELPALPDSLMFHVVCHGAASLVLPDGTCTPLAEGDLVLLPHGAGHVLASAPGTPAMPLQDAPRRSVGPQYERLRVGGTGAVSRLLCGAARVDGLAARALVARLPTAIRASSVHEGSDWLHGVLAMLSAAVRGDRPAADGMLSPVADVIVLHALRGWLDDAPDADAGWIGAMRDPRVGRAVAALQRSPATAWTIASLAREAGMSRSAFAARFATLTGEPVMQYVSRWRMQCAADALRREDVSIAVIAERVGYDSEAAFGRAFKRVLGVSPGRVRQRSSSRGGRR